MDADVRAGLKWPRLLNSDKVLTALTTKPLEELKRLEGLSVAKMHESLKLTDTAKEELAKDDAASADATLHEALGLWSTNELATRLSKDVTERKNAIATATPVPATPRPIMTPAPTPDASGAVVPPAVVAPEPEGPNYVLYGVISLVALVLVFAGLQAYKKIKAKANEIIE
jgi:hypothetical protein